MNNETGMILKNNCMGIFRNVILNTSSIPEGLNDDLTYLFEYNLER